MTSDTDASHPPDPTHAASHRRLAAVLWDFDGTLADTEPLWIDAEYELIAELGGSWTTEQAHKLVGSALIDSATFILQEIGRTDLEPAWVVEQLLGRVVAKIRATPLPWRPGALELLYALTAAGYRCALVSASYRVLLDAVMEQLEPGTFETSVAGDEVTRGKPHPESYLKACDQLGVRPQDCVVLEDSIPGAEAGNASGATVVAIQHMVPLPDAPKRVKVTSLAEVDPEALAAVLEPADAG